ncbi:MAG: class II aldolase/adducin family protein, partial [Anaerolineae bacterium]|nr:class II aldolase/adducin family protein [Anaerolineae bacterium]
MDSEIAEARAHIAEIGALLFDRQLTDAAGGNISVRVGDYVCISPRYSGSKRQWQLKPEDVLVADMNRSILEGKGEVSRESNVHFTLHADASFREAGTAVIHAHPRNLLVFAALAKPMPPVLEANRKFGEVKVVEYAPAHSPILAENVVGALRGQESRIRKQAAGVIAPWHGIFLMGKDLDAAFDAVQRFDANAYIILTAHAAGFG